MTVKTARKAILTGISETLTGARGGQTAAAGKIGIDKSAALGYDIAENPERRMEICWAA